MLTALKKGGRNGWVIIWCVFTFFIYDALIAHYLSFFADHASWKKFSKRMSGHECCCNVALLEKF